VPELMPWSGKVRTLVDVVSEVMDEPGYLVEARKDMLAAVRRCEATRQFASDNAADIIVNSSTQGGIRVRATWKCSFVSGSRCCRVADYRQRDAASPNAFSILEFVAIVNQ